MIFRYGRGYYAEQFCEIILNLDKWLWKKCSFKDISYLELWQPICSAEQNHLCNFGRGYYEEQLSEIILNLGQCQEILVKRFLILSSGGTLVRWSRTIYAILKEGTIGTFM